MRTFLSSRAKMLRQSLTLSAVLIAAVAVSTASWATSCPSTIALTNSNPQVTCVVPETNGNGSMNLDMKYLSFTSQAQGVVLIYNNSTHSQLDDIITFSNVNGVATATFQSDANGATLTPPGLPVLGSYTESKGYTLMSLALTDGKYLHVGICNDAGASTRCNGGGDSLRFSVGNNPVPEPGTFLLLGSGLAGVGVWKLRAKSWKRRVFNS